MINQRLLCVFTQSLSEHLNANIPLPEALFFLSQHARKPQLKQLADRLYASVNNGNLLSHAFSAFLPERHIAISFILIGEKTGRLNNMIQLLSQQLSARQSLTQQFKRCLYYPGFVLLISFGLLTFMFTYTIPQFKNLYQNFHHALPPVTQYLMDITQQWGFMANLFFLFMGILLTLYLQTPRQFIQRIYLKTPFLGSLISGFYLANACLLMGQLLEAKLTLVEVLTIVKESYHWEIFSTALSEIKASLLQGKALSVALRTPTPFPAFFIQAFCLAERNHSLPETCLSLSRHYTTTLREQAGMMVQFIGPVFLLLIGGVMGFILLALYLPIFSLGDVF